MKVIIARALVIGAALYAAPAFAAEADAVPATLFGAAAPIAVDELAGIAGAADVSMEVRANNSSEVSHNSVTNSQTGAIGIDGAAFANMNGLSVISANTGNNVSINSSLNVNVAFNP